MAIRGDASLIVSNFIFCLSVSLSSAFKIVYLLPFKLSNTFSLDSTFNSNAAFFSAILAQCLVLRVLFL